jgi:hypothetical protein
VWGAASPLWLALAGRGAPADRDAVAEALLRLGASGHGGARATANAGLLVGPGGVLAAVTPLGAAALRNDALAVARLLAAGAEPRRCVRVLALWLRCTRIGGRQAAAVMRDWQASAQSPQAAASSVAARAGALLHLLQSAPPAAGLLEGASAEELALLEAMLEATLEVQKLSPVDETNAAHTSS